MTRSLSGSSTARSKFAARAAFLRVRLTGFFFAFVAHGGCMVGKRVPFAGRIGIGGPARAALRLLSSNLKQLNGERTSERKVDVLGVPCRSRHVRPPFGS